MLLGQGQVNIMIHKVNKTNRWSSYKPISLYIYIAGSLLATQDHFPETLGQRLVLSYYGCLQTCKCSLITFAQLYSVKSFILHIYGVCLLISFHIKAVFSQYFQKFCEHEGPIDTWFIWIHLKYFEFVSDFLQGLIQYLRVTKKKEVFNINNGRPFPKWFYF